MPPNCPFSEILRPLAEEAMAGANAPPIVRAEFVRHLERRLSDVLSQCLFLHFTAHRMSAEFFRGSRKGVYAAFIEDARRQGADGLFADFPVAKAAIPTLGGQVRRFAEEFTEHLEADRPAMEALLKPRAGLSLTNLQAGLSDPHRGGRTVVKATFQNGTSIFYKPRSLAVEALWGGGLQRINRWLPSPLRAAAVADCATHGWMEAIPSRRDVTRDEAQRFYWRYGALLCLAWLLDAVDLHRENIVISRADPVVVDAEGLLHPLRPGEKRSLARTGMFPHFQRGFDVSGLGPVEAQPAGYSIGWNHIGADRLELEWQLKEAPAATHLPIVNGVLLPPRAAASFVQEGFAAAAKAARRDRGLIAAWRTELRSAPRRRFLRPTVSYATLFEEAAAPANLSARKAWRSAIARRVGQVSPDEWEQLGCWDYPVFDSGALGPARVPWSKLPGCFEELSLLAST